MTIASKLFILERSRSGRSSPPEASPPRRRGSRSSSGDHRRLVSSQSGKSPTSNLLRNSRHTLVNNEGLKGKNESEERLPDSVRQARERLVLRLRSINLSGSRETDDDSQNQPIMCRSQSDVMHFFCDITKKPILDISQVINDLKSIIFRAANEEEITGISFVECSICLEKFLEGEELTELNCKHTFHSRCLTRWVRLHSDCPYCRGPVA
ncbi:RING/U-box superfamily protein [Rhynchospora pubera]|uniref:RING/U-box superfamily protein n=1 Tax=Rhynchospora pubera TaxID=906938 RepID=A0AAV8GFJ2_9POAL|nr:RING/U-box superfamily protein [Rhynchospora pubera]